MAPDRLSSSLHQHLLVFEVEGRRIAFPLEPIEKVLPAVEITPWPHTPAFIAGVIDVRGQVLPVVRAEALLNEAFVSAVQSQPPTSAHFIVLRYEEMRVALWVTHVLEVVQTTVQPTKEEDSEHQERWQPIRLSEELTLLWNGRHLFDGHQTKALRDLSVNLSARGRI